MNTVQSTLLDQNHCLTLKQNGPLRHNINQCLMLDYFLSGFQCSDHRCVKCDQCFIVLYAHHNAATLGA